MKQTFLSTNLACLLAFEQWAAGPYHILSITISSKLTFFFYAFALWTYNTYNLSAQQKMKTHVLKQGQLKKLARKLAETQGPCSYHGHWMKKLTQRKVESWRPGKDSVREEMW